LARNFFFYGNFIFSTIESDWGKLEETIKTDVCSLYLSILNGPEEGAVRGREAGRKGVHFTVRNTATQHDMGMTPQIKLA